MGNLKTLKTKVIVNNTGYNTWFASTSMKASCKINVKYFPFDQQICRLTFGYVAINYLLSSGTKLLNDTKHPR